MSYDFFITFAAMFSAQVLVSFIQWIIKKYVEPWWETGHNKLVGGFNGSEKR